MQCAGSMARSDRTGAGPALAALVSHGLDQGSAAATAARRHPGEGVPARCSMEMGTLAALVFLPSIMGELQTGVPAPGGAGPSALIHGRAAATAATAAGARQRPREPQWAASRSRGGILRRWAALASQSICYPFLTKRYCNIECASCGRCEPVDCLVISKFLWISFTWNRTI